MVIIWMSPLVFFKGIRGDFKFYNKIVSKQIE